MTAASIERNGDHLGLWVLELQWYTGSRSIWFEKGRIYNKPGVGPPGGSSAAVACWSFATTVVGRTWATSGRVELPVDERARIDASPAQVWGVAVDRRGWPWAAFEGRTVGTMDKASASPFVVEVGEAIPANASIFGLGRPSAGYGMTGSLADVRMLPTRPLWRGLVLDVVWMTAFWWVVLRLGGAVRSGIVERRRKRAGGCKKCGYDLAGLSGGVCPECGTGILRE